MCAHYVAVLEKYHLLMCEWANCGQLRVNRDNIQQIVMVLHTCVSYFIMYYVTTFNDLNNDEPNKKIMG